MIADGGQEVRKSGNLEGKKIGSLEGKPFTLNSLSSNPPTLLSSSNHSGGNASLIPPYGLKRNAAFTLAEVLITLGIIGIVAALTLPTLISNHKKQVYVTQLKKAYAVLNQGFKKYMVDNDCIDDIQGCGFEWTGGYDNFVVPIKQGFEVIDYDERLSNSNFTKDFAKYKVSESLNPVKYDSDYGRSAYYIFLLKDGSNFLATVSYIGYLITYDINGKKGPNIYGRDIFEFALLENGSVVPWLSKAHLNWLYKLTASEVFKDLYDQVLESGCGKYGENKLPADASGISGFGSTCADRIIYDGWRMNY